ncbi:Vacuolar protein sorting-associated protein 8 [Emydomyces testavorans]|uniref:Vacuolar protein sorting-associated protein 8 n=1 Tax=Emydomyces testavorans TaxID=2070801 RepID=A0AAF0IIE4_9EURO|nr:Vacuolar protein sorting-associated protein 8 [Emydomyces testavorans]
MSERGSDDDAVRDDEIDLHDEEEQLQPASNGLEGAQVYPAEEEEAFDEFVTPDDPVSIAVGDDEIDVPSAQHGEVAASPQSSIRGTRSPDDAGSIPDDSPSLQGSVQSSPSSTLGHRSPASLGHSPHRPFDLRFQTRLSASFPSTVRPLSPSFLQSHSRQSSLASQIRTATPDFPEEPSPAPWEVVRWTKLRKIATASGAVTSLAISADHTTVAGGHADGTIFTWELSKPARPFLHISPSTASGKDFKRGDGHISGVAVIHVGFLGSRRTALVSADDHGMAFSHLATRGMGAVARTIKTTRILGRYPQSVLPAGRTRKPSTVLAFSPLPLGNVEQGTDSLGLVAMLTPYLLVIVSTTPVAQTQHKSARPKEVPAHSAMTAALAWFPAIKLKAKDTEISKTKLVYCWSNVLTVLEVSEIKPADPDDSDKPPRFAFKPFARWRATEPIVAVQWISRSVLAVLSITQQLLILEDKSLRVTDSFDLLHKHIYHADLFSKQLQSLVEQLDDEDQTMHGVTADAFYMSFRAYKGRLFLLGFNEISVGTLSNWADRLLALMECGDFIGSIRLATAFYIGSSEKLTVGLPEEDALRHQVVQEKLLEMMGASLRYAFGKNEEANTERADPRQLQELAEACIAACDAMNNQEFLFDEVYPWYEDYGSEHIFLDVLEPYIVQGNFRTLPPGAVKSLISHFSTNHTASRLEEIICLLDTSTIDIDQVTSLCKHYNLYDAFIYVWNRAIGDYISPLRELLDLAIRDATAAVNGDAETETKDHANAGKMFPYLSYILTGRIYPTGHELEEPEASQAKTDIYSFLCSAKNSGSPQAGERDYTDHAFKNLRIMLEFDTPKFMSMLNEAFEDSFLNDVLEDTENGGPELPGHAKRDLFINRQYLISILLEVMEPSSDFPTTDTIYLDMFIARNLPKYPQYILLSGSILHQVLVRLCNYPSPDLLADCQLSAEYLLSTYHPPDIQSLIPLFKEARFFRILKSTYRAERQYSELLLTYLEDSEDQKSIFTCMHDCLRLGSSLTGKQRRDVRSVIEKHAAELAQIDVAEAAHTIQSVAPELHEIFVQALEPDPRLQYQYLGSLLAPEWKSKTEIKTAELNHQVIERYIELMCQYDPLRVTDFVDTLKVGDLQLDTILPSIESSGIVDAVVILVAKQGEIDRAMERLIKHLATLEAGLSGILQNVEESPDSSAMAETVVDLVQSLEKYTKVGIWLCQSQTKSTRRPYREGKLNKRGSIFEQPLSSYEKLWLMLIEAVVNITQNVSPLLEVDFSQKGAIKSTSWLKATESKAVQLPVSLRTLVQQVFTALLTTTTKPGHMPNEKVDLSFLRILRAFLTRAASASPSLSELRAVIASILSAYSYEESLLSLANTMLDKDLFVHVDEITKLRQRGWRARGQVCEICRRRAWGPGAGGHLWEAWEAKQAADAKRKQDKQVDQSSDRDVESRGKGKALAASHAAASSGAGHGGDGAVKRPEGGGGLGPLIIFGCRHLYHRTCLVDESERRRQEGQSASSMQESRYSDGRLGFSCLICI